jgi:tetratricopeptide (TPR) repeat protein
LPTNPEEAAHQLEAAAGPDASGMIDFTLGNIHFQQERLEEAEASYRTAIDKFPTFRRAYKNLALVQMRRGATDDAIRSFTRLIELGGADSFSYGLLGQAYTVKADWLAAESAYRSALLLAPDHLDWRIGLARCAFRQQKYGEAAALIEKLLEQAPDRADLWLLQANAYVGMKQPLDAAENLEIVARTGKATVDSLYLLGDIYVNEGLTGLAAGAYRRAIERDADQAPARALRAAEALAARGANDEARTVGTTLRERLGSRVSTDEQRALLKLEARMAVAEGKEGEAVRVLEEVVALDPLDGEALLLLGQHEAKAGDTERALLYYERAGNVDRFAAPARLRAAQLLASQGKYPEAVTLLKRAQELDPKDEVARYLEQVERAARAAR